MTQEQRRRLNKLGKDDLINEIINLNHRIFNLNGQIKDLKKQIKKERYEREN